MAANNSESVDTDPPPPSHSDTHLERVPVAVLGYR